MSDNSVETLSRKKVFAQGVNAFLGTAIALNTVAGEVIVVCSNREAIEHAFKSLMPKWAADDLTINDDALVDVAIIQEKDIIFSKG